MNRVNLVMGDYSGDGHMQQETMLIECNLTTLEIADAYKKGRAIVGWDLSETVADEYEDNKISLEKCNRLKELGYDTGFEGEGWVDEDDEEGPRISTIEFAHVYMFFVWLGNKDVVWEFVNDSTGKLNIGGYGLFP
jgi:hypothetical protein